MVTAIDKAIAALLSSGALTAILPLFGGPFADPKFDVAIIGVITGIVTYLVPNKS